MIYDVRVNDQRQPRADGDTAAQVLFEHLEKRLPSDRPCTLGALRVGEGRASADVFAGAGSSPVLSIEVTPAR